MGGKSARLHRSLKEKRVWTAEWRSLNEARESIKRYLREQNDDRRYRGLWDRPREVFQELADVRKPRPGMSKLARSITQAKLRERLVLDGGLFLLLCLIAAGVCYFYVRAEHMFYYWDWANFQNLTSTKAVDFRKSPLWAIYGIKDSLGHDYNEIFTVPLIPFILIFGDSRPVYIISLALIYLLPFVLVMGAVATKLISFNPRAVFWSTVLLTLLIPAAWVPTLRGYPDAGAAFLIGLAIWVYLKDTSLRRWSQMALIGFLVAAAALFRRHYAYGGVAFFISIMLQALIAFVAQVWQQPRAALRELFERAVRLCLTGAASLMTLAVIGRPFLHNVLNHDYGALYASYREPYGAVVEFYVLRYGWGFWLLAVLGYTVGIRTCVVARPVAIFIALFGSLSLLQWVVLVGQGGRHFALHFTSFVVLGIAALGWTAWSRLRGRLRALMLSAVVIYLILNFCNALTPVDIVRNYRIRPLFSAKDPPRVREDYDEIVRLIAYLRTMAPPKEPIFVAASSVAFNSDLVKNAERMLYGRDKNVLNVLSSPDIDSRDFYPLEKLLQAEYVLVATPFQHHLRAEEQKVVKVVSVAFSENWEISQDFVQLPVQFFLADGRIIVHKRRRPTSLETALRTLQAMQEFVGVRPGGQLDWIILSQLFQSSIGKNRDSTYNLYIETGPASHKRGPMASFFYLGKLPQQAKMTGILSFYNDRCSGAKLRLAVVSPQDTITDAAEIVRQPGGTSEFAFSFQTQDAAGLLLNVSSHDENDLDCCSLKIGHLGIFASPR